jgi:hypothetical protein
MEGDAIHNSKLSLELMYDDSVACKIFESFQLYYRTSSRAVKSFAMQISFSYSFTELFRREVYSP